MESTHPDLKSSENSETSNQQATIFNNLIDTDEYEKKFKSARTWIYVIAGFQFAMGIFEFIKEEETVAWIALGIDWTVALIFLLLGLWSRKKPAAAFLSALIFYLLMVTAFAAIDISNVLKGIIFKILIVIALVKAYNTAREYENMKKAI